MTAVARDLVLAAAALACGLAWGQVRGHEEATEVRASCVVALAFANGALEQAQLAVEGCVEASGMPRVREVRR